MWGAAAIGQVIGRSKNQTNYLLWKGLIRSARKVGGLWCASPEALRREFGAVDVEQQRDREVA